MSEEGTLTGNGEVIRKAGAGASSTATAEAYTNQFIKEAEGFIVNLTRYDWVTNYGSLASSTKEILREASSNLAAMYCIQYDMSGFTSRTEAETMLDVLRDGAERCLGLLIDQNQVTYAQP